jgi:hypothetical protein
MVGALANELLANTPPDDSSENTIEGRKMLNPLRRSGRHCNGTGNELKAKKTYYANKLT